MFLDFVDFLCMFVFIIPPALWATCGLEGTSVQQSSMPSSPASLGRGSPLPWTLLGRIYGLRDHFGSLFGGILSQRSLLCGWGRLVGVVRSAKHFLCSFNNVIMIAYAFSSWIVIVVIVSDRLWFYVKWFSLHDFLWSKKQYKRGIHEFSWFMSCFVTINGCTKLGGAILAASHTKLFRLTRIWRSQGLLLSRNRRQGWICGFWTSQVEWMRKYRIPDEMGQIQLCGALDRCKWIPYFIGWILKGFRHKNNIAKIQQQQTSWASDLTS